MPRSRRTRFVCGWQGSPGCAWVPAELTIQVRPAARLACRKRYSIIGDRQTLARQTARTVNGFDVICQRVTLVLLGAYPSIGDPRQVDTVRPRRGTPPVIAKLLAFMTIPLLIVATGTTHVGAADRSEPHNSDVFARILPGGRTVIKANFNRRPVGPVSPESFNAEVGATNRQRAAYDDMTYVPDSHGPGRAVRTTLEKGTIAGQPTGNHGAVLLVKLKGSYDRACIFYRVRFSPGFDWSLGGKLPGLLGVAPGVSPWTPAGGGSTAAGWSARVMWLGPRAYGWAKPRNMGVTYLYHPGQATKWGDNIRWNRAFASGRWHSIRQCHVMNTVGRTDGQLLVWLDGQPVRDDTDVVYRTRSDVHITHLAWSVFRGGNTLDWAGDRTCYVELDSLLIRAG